MNLLKGENYRSLRPVITINIIGFKLLPKEDPHAMYGLYNIETKDLLNKDIEIHFLEMSSGGGPAFLPAYLFLQEAARQRCCAIFQHALRLTAPIHIDEAEPVASGTTMKAHTRKPKRKRDELREGLPARRTPSISRKQSASANAIRERHS